MDLVLRYDTEIIQGEGADLEVDWKMLYPQQIVDLQGMDALFTVEEIKGAIYDLAKDKSPGPDGLPKSFCQKYWEVLKLD